MIPAGSTGSFKGKDSSGKLIIIEWECIDARSPHLSEKIRSLSATLIEAYTKIELQFARLHPHAIKDEMFLKPLIPLLKNGIEEIDWQVAEEQIRSNLKQFLTETDWTKFSSDSESHLFATIKEQDTYQLSGMIQFIISAEYGDGNIKVALYDGVTQSQCNTNALLLSSIFKLIPDTKRLFLHTRITNEAAINNHEEYGFSRFTGSLPYWTDLEYRSEQADILQKIAETLLEMGKGK